MVGLRTKGSVRAFTGVATQQATASPTQHGSCTCQHLEQLLLLLSLSRMWHHSKHQRSAGLRSHGMAVLHASLTDLSRSNRLGFPHQYGGLWPHDIGPNLTCSLEASDPVCSKAGITLRCACCCRQVCLVAWRKSPNIPSVLAETGQASSGHMAHPQVLHVNMQVKREKSLPTPTRWTASALCNRQASNGLDHHNDAHAGK